MHSTGKKTFRKVDFYEAPGDECPVMSGAAKMPGVENREAGDLARGRVCSGTDRPWLPGCDRLLNPTRQATV